MQSEVFKKYYKKIGRESVLKSLLCGLTAGFSLAFVCIGVSWLLGVKSGIFIGAGLFVAGMATSPIFYKLRFKPTSKKIAKRIDELGLEERMITMAELENDDSFMAMKQREDALNAMKTVNSDMLKIAVSVPLIAAVAISATLGTGITVAAAVAPDGGKSFVESFKEKKTYEITYAVEGKGWVIDFSKNENAKLIEAKNKREEQRKKDEINGKDVTEDEKIPGAFSKRLNIALALDEKEDAVATTILDGANAQDVTYKISVTEGDEFSITLMALPQEGYVFVGWSDGVISPYREDVGVSESKTITAVFDEVANWQDGEGDSGEEGGESGKEGDSDPDASGNSGGDPSKGNGSSDGSSSGDGIDGAKESEANRVIDGQTYYGDVFDDYYREMLERMSGDGSLSEAEKKAISDYLDSIRET